MVMNLRDWVRGCQKPMSFGAKASLKKDVIGVFCTVIVPDMYVGGPLVIKHGQPENRGITNDMIFELPDHQFFGGL